MARRADHTKEELKELIMQEAFSIITEEGLQGLSTRAIAKKIGYTVGTIYNVFKSYDDLIIHINYRILEDLLNHLELKSVNAVNTRDYLVSLALKYILYSQEHYNLWQCLFEYRVGAEFQKPVWYEEKLSDIFQAVEQCFEENPTENSRSLWAGIHGICVLLHSGKNTLLSTATIENLVEFMVDKYVSY